MKNLFSLKNLTFRFIITLNVSNQRRKQGFRYCWWSTWWWIKIFVDQNLAQDNQRRSSLRRHQTRRAKILQFVAVRKCTPSCWPSHQKVQSRVGFYIKRDWCFTTT